MIAGFVLGFLGSLHCIGMCGPLAMALPIPKERRFLGILMYNLGRVITYTTIGLLFGMIGATLVMAGWQQGFSLGLGILMLILVLTPHVSKRINRSFQQSLWMSWIKESIKTNFKNRSLTSALITGLLNGFLPCGLVYVAIVGALAMGDLVKSSLFMAYFGFGTIPVMFILSLIPTFLKFRFVSKWVAPTMSFVFAFLLIYRGLALDLPQVDELLIRSGLEDIAICR